LNADEAAQKKDASTPGKNQTAERRGCRTRAMPEATPREIELSEELARATGELADARMENKLLREKVDALIHRIFGAQSEKLDREQLLLMLQGFDSPGNEVSRSLFASRT
jgi:hypothetical protein